MVMHMLLLSACLFTECHCMCMVLVLSFIQCIHDCALVAHSRASYPGLFVWVERRGWYPLLAHASIKYTCAK